MFTHYFVRSRLVYPTEMVRGVMDGGWKLEMVHKILGNKVLLASIIKNESAYLVFCVAIMG
jgi:hypothetical protein